LSFLLRKSLRIPAFLVALTVLGACRSATLVIESTTSWSGTITEAGKPAYKVEGTGNRIFEMPTDDFCWTLQKQTADGRLYAVAKIPAFLSTDEGGERETFAEFGTVVACSGTT
jgi:hypothetical protein